ncbi:MAG: hypothetical protein KGH64_00680 [Candidatus Micrarchaeota archaeon]|nr:hypothetical protein [Candidatus Micrarchaeota archaeon]
MRQFKVSEFHYLVVKNNAGQYLDIDHKWVDSIDKGMRLSTFYAFHLAKSVGGTVYGVVE